MLPESVFGSVRDVKTVDPKIIFARIDALKGYGSTLIWGEGGEINHLVKHQGLVFPPFGGLWPYFRWGIKKNVTGAKKPLDLTRPNR